MKILVTGGSGFLGSALTRALVEQGHDVAVIVRAESKLERLDSVLGKYRLERCSTDAEVVEVVISQCPDIIIHTACAQGRKGESYLQLTDVNLRLGLVLMQALGRTNQSAIFINCGTALNADVNYYSLTKCQFAQCGMQISKDSSGAISFINAKLQHIYGPGDDPSKFVTHVIKACHSEDYELKLTAGAQRRDFIFVDDAVSAFVALVDNASSIQPCSTVDIGSGKAPTIRDLVETIHRLCHSNTRLSFGALPYREKEAMHCEADTGYLRSLGWEPRVSLEHGLNQIIQRDFANAGSSSLM